MWPLLQDAQNLLTFPRGASVGLHSSELKNKVMGIRDTLDKLEAWTQVSTKRQG